MNVSSRMTIADATDQFLNIMRSLDELDKQKFLTFIADGWKPSTITVPNGEERNDTSINQCDTSGKIKRIISDIRQRVPFDAILPSENITPPKNGENSDCDPNITIHVDGFLYDDNDIDDLIDEGKIQNYYCSDCGSKNVQACVIISHSMSVDIMLHVFGNLLPPLSEKTVLDVGSRLGAVLYGAHEFSDAKRIVGVEMNAELCDLQREMIRKYGMEKRVEIINKRIEECPDLVQNSDVIIINNAFEFYVPESVHTDIWRFLKANTRKGTILVTRPHLETTFKCLKVGFATNDWVKQYDSGVINCSDALNFDLDKYTDIGCYEVL